MFSARNRSGVLEGGGSAFGRGVIAAVLAAFALAGCATQAERGPASTQAVAPPEAQSEADANPATAQEAEKFDEAVVVDGSEAALQRFPQGYVHDAAVPLCLEDGEHLTILTGDGTRRFYGPGCYAPDKLDSAQATSAAGPTSATGATPSRRLRSGAVRGAAVPEQMIVYRGTASALARFPRGTRRPAAAKICLDRGEQITLIGDKGRRVTYGGPGCNKRVGGGEGDQAPAATTGALDRRWDNSGKQQAALH